jgi:hypothetical protein
VIGTSWLGFFSTILTAASQDDTLILLIETISSPINRLAFSAGPPGATKSITASWSVGIASPSIAPIAEKTKKSQDDIHDYSST